MNGSNKVLILSGSSTLSTLPNNLSNTKTVGTLLLLNYGVKHSTEKDHQTVPNIQILDSTNKEHTAQNPVQLVPNNHIIEPEQTPKYMLSLKGKYLEIDNYFSEYDTKEKKRTARKNLGIEGFAEWGNIEGYVEDQKDLVDYIQDKIDTVLDQLGEVESKVDESELKIDEVNLKIDEIESKVDEVDSLINDYIFKEVIPLVEQLETEMDGLDETVNQVNSNLGSKVSVEIDTETQASKQIQYSLKNSDLKLNNDFNNALKAVLGGHDIKSIDDAISILLHKMFPVTYTDWSMHISNTATKSYNIEKGTSVALNSNEKLGTVTITLTRGNKGDQLSDVTINSDSVFESGKTTYSFDVYVSDLTDKTSINSSVSKTYTVSYSTTLPRTALSSTQAKITVVNLLYYFFAKGTERVTAIDANAVKQLSNEYLFDLGNTPLYLSVFSPFNLNLYTKVGSSPDNLDSVYRPISGFVHAEVSYTPQNGTTLKYYLFSVLDPQTLYVKVKVAATA